MNIRHYINGQDLGEPRNWEGLEISKDFLNDSEDADINITELEFVLKANRYFQDRVLNGLSGGVGIFEGDPYRIIVGNQDDPSYVFEGYLDFTDGTTVIGREEFVTSLKKRKGSDWLNDVAYGFSFAYLADQGVITSGDYVRVPYVINYVPDGLQILILSLSLYMMTKELIENVLSISEAIGDVTDAATPVIGVSVGIGAGVVTASDIGNFILVIIKTAAKIAYIIAIVIAIKKLLETLFEELLPKKRYHLGMSLRRMFERACQHLGLNFESSISDLDIVHIPRKDKRGGEDGESGFPTNSGPMYTFGDFIVTMRQMFNAEYKITNGVLRFERKDNFDRPGRYSIPSYFQDQERLLDVYTFNTEEMVSNYNIFFQYDVQDQNTIDDQTGRVFQAITEPVFTVNPDLVNIKNISEVNLPFSLGKRKESLNRVELLLRELSKFVDALTGVFGKGTRFSSKINDRRGSLLLSSHFLTSGKLVKMSGTNLAPNQRDLISAKNLWDRYHFVNSFAEVSGRHNQYWRYLEIRVPMSLNEFTTLSDNNISQDENGNEIIIEKVVYSPGLGSAVIDYRVNKKYTNNLKVTYVE